MSTQRGVKTVSYSEIDAYRQCPFKHHLAYRERWSKPVDPMSSLGKGTMWHNVMQVHYTSLKETQMWAGVSADELSNKRINEARAKVHQYLDEALINYESSELIALMKWMYDGYIEAWKDDSDWIILAVENTVIVPLMVPDGILYRKTRFNLKVKTDLIIRDRKTGFISIVDHKSCGDLPKDKDFDFEEQFGLYELVLNRVGWKVFNTIHNAARTRQNKGDIIKPGDEGYKSTMKAQTLDDRFSRSYMKRTKQELATIEAEAVATLTTAYSKRATVERHVSSDTCKWRCNFTESCLLGRRTGDNNRTIEMLKDTGFEQNFERH